MPKSNDTNRNGLNAMQLAFCYEYIATKFRVEQAAINAGYSLKTAASQGSQLLKKTKIKAEIERLKAEHMKDTIAKAEDILAELAIIGFADMTELFEQGKGELTVKEFEKLGPIRRAIKSIKVIPQGYSGSGKNRKKIPDKVEFTLCSKEKALELLGTNQDLFIKKMKFGDGDENALPVMLVMPDNRRDDGHPGRKKS